MGLFSKLHMSASVVDPNCSTAQISTADLVVSLGEAAIVNRDVATYVA